MLLYFIAILVTRKCGFSKRRQDNRLKKKKDIYSILEEINMIKDTKTNHALAYSDCTKEKIVSKIILMIGGGRTFHSNEQIQRPPESKMPYIYTKVP